MAVYTNSDIAVATEGWQKAKVEDVDLDEETGTAILAIPATAETGFMILKSKTAVSDVDLWLREHPEGQDDEEFYGPHIE